MSTGTALNAQLDAAVRALYNFNNDQYGFFDGTYKLGGGEAFYDFASEANTFLTNIFYASAGPITAAQAISLLDDYKNYVAAGRSGTLRIKGVTRVWLSACSADKLTQAATNLQAMFTFAVNNPTVSTYNLAPLRYCPEPVTLDLTASSLTALVGSTVTVTPQPKDLGGRWARFVDDAPARDVWIDYDVFGAATASGQYTKAPLQVTGTAPGVVTVNARVVEEVLEPTASIQIEFVAPTLTMSVTPAAAVVVPGEALDIWATAKDDSGRDYAMTWVSSDPSVAPIEGVYTGGGRVVVRGLGPGVTTITGSVGNQTVSMILTVSPPVSQVKVLGAAPLTQGGSILPLTAVAVYPDLSENSSLPARWVSSVPTVASVSATGVVTPIAPGTATISAVIGSKTGSATITVAPAPIASLSLDASGLTLPLSATWPVGLTALDTRGMAPYVGPLRPSSPVWTATGGAGVSSGGATGATLVGSSEGPGSLAVQWEAASAAVNVIIRAPLASVTVSPATHTFPPETDPASGPTVQLNAALVNSLGATIDAVAQPWQARIVTWSSSDPSVASVDANGLVTILKGSDDPVTITATVLDAFSTGLSTTLTGTSSIIPPPPACEFPGKGGGVSEAVKEKFCAKHPDFPGTNRDGDKANPGKGKGNGKGG